MAIDATLAGDPADPEYAELAELALILRRERPRTSDAFAARLDEQVQRRFARPAPAVRGTGLRRWLTGSLAGLAAAAAATVLVIVINNGSHGTSDSVTFGSAGAGPSTVISSSSAAASTSASAGTASGSAGSAASGRAGPDAQRLARPGAIALPHAPNTHGYGALKSAQSSPASGAAQAAAPAPATTIPSPVTPGKRQLVQSAQLILSVAARKIDDVSQQVFDVVGQEKGYVNGSNVSSGGPDGNAFFQLSVPSSNLAATLAALSDLKGAHVVSRTDNTNDITGQVGGAGQKLGEARALRRSLLKQLADATTTAEVDSLQARIHDANASIGSDLSKLRGLQRQVAYSNITVRIQTGTVVPRPVTHHPSSGFTIGKAGHDAGRVLVVAAGVGLIVLAVLIPVGLVAALLAWVGYAVRRRRRDHALDLV
jgi:hypothetical protein